MVLAPSLACRTSTDGMGKSSSVHEDYTLVSFKLLGGEGERTETPSEQAKIMSPACKGRTMGSGMFLSFSPAT